MESIKNKVTSAVTGDAYDKPAKTEAGAFTKQGSSNAATTDGTSADPNSTGSSVGDKAEQATDKATGGSNTQQDINKGLGQAESREGLPDNANVNNKISGQAASRF
ncbi:MAG: hypothetical protein M1818_001636 [Claussenomyces sp. TS43310]|nr:MAG: hypothetical protein M1818_001636 [Claussenomyces sp. TS43310]